eukprot:1294888-Pleurochrysis_carterae.AAC.1
MTESTPLTQPPLHLLTRMKPICVVSCGIGGTTTLFHVVAVYATISLRQPRHVRSVNLPSANIVSRACAVGPLRARRDLYARRPAVARGQSVQAHRALRRGE